MGNPTGHLVFALIMALSTLPLSPNTTTAQTFLDPTNLLEIPEALSLMKQPNQKIDTEIVVPPSSEIDGTTAPPYLVRASTSFPPDSHSDIIAEIYFDRKRQALREDAAQIVEHTAALLEKDAPRRLHVETVCDERGTEAYSMTLGRQRTAAVAAYLQTLDAPMESVSQISHGSRLHCHTLDQACAQERQRLRQIFRLLSMSSPQSGCLVQIHLQGNRTTPAAMDYKTRQPFLQRLHLAESR